MKTAAGDRPRSRSLGASTSVQGFRVGDRDHFIFLLARGKRGPGADRRARRRASRAASGEFQLIRPAPASASSSPTRVTIRSTVVLVGEGDGGAEPDPAPVGLAGRIGDLGLLHPLRQEVDPPVDLAQPLAAILIIGILGAVAIRRRPGDRLDQLRPLAAEQGLIFLAQPPVAGGRDVVRSVGIMSRAAVRAVSPGRFWPR